MPKANTTKKGSKTSNENVDIQTTENLVEDVKEAKTTTKKSGSEPTVTTRYVRPRGIKDKYIKGAINGKPFKVPYNKTVTIPVSVDKRIMFSLAAEDFADEYIEREKSDPDEDNE